MRSRVRFSVSAPLNLTPNSCDLDHNFYKKTSLFTDNFLSNNFYFCDPDHNLSEINSFQVKFCTNLAQNQYQLTSSVYSYNSCNIKNNKISKKYSNSPEKKQERFNDINKEKVIDLYADFSVFGRIYLSQIRADLTSAQIIVLGCITDLCSSDFAKKNSGYITFTDEQIQKKLNFKYSLKQVKRHISALEENGLITIDYKKTYLNNLTRHIKLNQSPSGSFIPIIAPNELHLTHSEILVLSLILNKSTFFTRAGENACVRISQLNNINTILFNLSSKTIKNSLSKFISDKVLYQEDSILNCYNIDKQLSAKYQSKFKVNLSERASRLKNNQAKNKHNNNTYNFINNNLSGNGYFKAKFFAESFLDNCDKLEDKFFLASCSEDQVKEINTFKTWHKAVCRAIKNNTVFYTYSFSKCGENHRENRISKNADGKKRIIQQVQIEKKGLSNRFKWKKKDFSTEIFL